MVIKNNPRCLIGTLYVGENELEACEAALQEQNYTNWEYIRLDHLSEQEAHDKLYSSFMENRKEFDFFVKLDADMILRHTDALGEMIKFFQKRPSLDHACFTVHDYMTNCPILGLHMFTNKAVWEKTRHCYFPDKNPIVPGDRLAVRSLPAPVAYHAYDPTPYQAFHFGAHRMLKALNSNSSIMEVFQWNVMHWVARHAKHNADPRLRFALLGGWHVWNGDLGENANEAKDPKKLNLFARYIDADSKTLDQAIPLDWLKIVRKYRWLKRFCYTYTQKIGITKQRLKGWRMIRKGNF